MLTQISLPTAAAVAAAVALPAGAATINSANTPGDIYFTNHQAWHRGAPNTSDRIRYVMQLQYAQRWADRRFSGRA